LSQRGVYERVGRLKEGRTSAVDARSGRSTVVTYAEIRKQSDQNIQGYRKINTAKMYLVGYSSMLRK
jgi:hypothetical protein